MIRYAVFLLIFASSLFAESDPSWREWNKPFEPFRIVGNIYYVGATNISSFAIKTNKGIILIDGGFPETAPQVLANVKKLGFDEKQVKILLNSHAHFDHAGGLAELKRVTGAKLYAAEGDKRVLEEGGHNDFGFGDSMLFPKVKVDRTIHSGERVTLGDTELTATVTPGHTKGCTTWSMHTKEGKADYNVVFVCSLSVPGFKLVNNPKYPNIVDDYQHSFGLVKKMRADVFLAPHGDFFDLKGRYERLKSGDRKAFVDPTALRRYVAGAEESFNKELEKQRATATAAK
jgi:metallo-beta-lactamase class B